MSLAQSLGAAKRARNVGAEAWFELQHLRYRQDRRAVIARCHFPVSGAPQHMRPTGKGDTDFVGGIRLDGRPIPVAFDLKVNRQASFRVDPIEFPELVRQVQLLLDLWDLGGVGFLALLDPAAGELWMLGREPIAWLLANPRQHFKYRAQHGEVWTPEYDDMPGVACVREADPPTLARTGIRYDWLTAIPRLIASHADAT